MISYLKGTVIDKTDVSVTILTNGVGYEVFLPESQLHKLKPDQDASLFIYTHVREDILALYGFTEKGELAFFKLLLSVSGIGPKVALSIIGSTSIEKIISSITRGDSTLLSAVSGVGKKTAEKAVIELKGKLGPDLSNGKYNFGDETDEVYSALLTLGFQKYEITEAISRLPEDITGTDAKIKAILKNIGKKK